MYQAPQQPILWLKKSIKFIKDMKRTFNLKISFKTWKTDSRDPLPALFYTLQNLLKRRSKSTQDPSDCWHPTRKRGPLSDEMKFIRVQYGCFQKRGTPKWMIKIMENTIRMDDLGAKKPIFGNTHIYPYLNNDWKRALLKLGHSNMHDHMEEDLPKKIAFGWRDRNILGMPGRSDDYFTIFTKYDQISISTKAKGDGIGFYHQPRTIHCYPSCCELCHLFWSWCLGRGGNRPCTSCTHHAPSVTLPSASDLLRGRPENPTRIPSILSLARCYPYEWLKSSLKKRAGIL